MLVKCHRAPDWCITWEVGAHESILRITDVAFFEPGILPFASRRVRSFYQIFKRSVSYQKSLRPSVLAHPLRREGSVTLIVTDKLTH